MTLCDVPLRGAAERLAGIPGFALGDGAGVDYQAAISHADAHGVHRPRRRTLDDLPVARVRGPVARAAEDAVDGSSIVRLLVGRAARDGTAQVSKPLPQATTSGFS